MDTLFSRLATVQIVLDALLYRQQQHNWRIYGYVILENHLHLLVQADDLTHQLAHFKSYTARQLIDYLQAVNAERLLKQLNWFREAHKTDREYQLWEEGSHPQMIDNPDVLRQKLEYIHLNQVKRDYVDLPEHWRYSSARNYAGQEGLLPVYRDWF
ncbi:transposase [Methylomonas sp. EFPC1]|nr:transposase [Methylomonas sp. LW13]QSB03529.1 transposase [Methylomonas sp. EFPC1]